jgi:hypothetical protein
VIAMSKLIIEPVQPELSTDARALRAFRWRGRFYRISEIGGKWAETGHWWEGQEECKFCRVLTDRNLVADLCFEPRYGQWWLYRLYD